MFSVFVQIHSVSTAFKFKSYKLCSSIEHTKIVIIMFSNWPVPNKKSEDTKRIFKSRKSKRTQQNHVKKRKKKDKQHCTKHCIKNKPEHNQNPENVSLNRCFSFITNYDLSLPKTRYLYLPIHYSIL